MKPAIRKLIVPAAFVFTLAALMPLAAQQWSDSQKEVLENLKTYSEITVKKDLEGVMSYFHPDFRGWDYAEGLPFDKASNRKVYEYYFGKYSFVSFDINPVSIQVVGKIAIVHCYYKEILRGATGVDTLFSGRWSLTMLKQDDKWVFLSWSWLAKAQTL